MIKRCYLCSFFNLVAETKIASMAESNFALKALRKGSIYRYVKEDGVLANCLSKAGAGSVFRVVCGICGQGFKGKNQAYKHLERHNDVVLEKNQGHWIISKEQQ